MDSTNLYEILGVDISANEMEIRRAYFEKAKLFHPDTGSSDSKNFEQIREAYVALLDPVTRASYDKGIGVRQNFGISESIKELGDYSPLSNGSLQFEQGNSTGIWYRLQSALSNLFRRRKRPNSESNLSSNQAVNNDPFTETVRTALAIYSEDSFPLGQGEKIVIRAPSNNQEVEDCTTILRKSFEKYPIISRAVLIEASVSSLPEQKVFLILLEKQIARSWGIDSLHSLEVENYPENLPGMLLCSANNGPFSEAVNLYGIAIYPAITAQNIN